MGDERNLGWSHVQGTAKVVDATGVLIEPVTRFAVRAARPLP
jgi:hypothetical protein